MFGFLLGVMMVPTQFGELQGISKKKERIMFWFAAITALGLFILYILLFFLSTKKPTKFWYITSSNSLDQIAKSVIETTTSSTNSPLLVPVSGN